MSSDMLFRRVWCMPDSLTFNMKPVTELLKKYCTGIVVDPFARNSTFGTITNDLDPSTSAQYHLKSTDFANELIRLNTVADVILFDPPYSPRQTSECYKSVGLKVGMQETQTAKLYSDSRNLLIRILKLGGITISFGWNSTGFGKNRGFEFVEGLLIAHGGAHNDTIVVVERKII